MLAILPYHQRVIDHFRTQPKTWDYFAGSKTRSEQLREFKMELLKNTYKFDNTSDAHIYDKINIIKEQLGLQHLPVTVYQSQYTDELNASIVYIDNEAHIVFSGAVTRLLDEGELLAVLAHELTHIKLYTSANGDAEVASRIMAAIANNYNSDASYIETARLFRLYTEIFCDRGACQVLGKTEPVISSLVKISTGLDKVSAETYIRQADEIFSNDNTIKAVTVSHPENFIRAKAIQLWHDRKEQAEPEIVRMIEGAIDLDQLDIFRQQEMASLTRKVLQLFLKPKWFQTTLVNSLAKQYFPDFTFDDTLLLDSDIIERTGNFHPGLRDYFAYVLLDFVLADPALDLVPAGWSFQFADDIQLANTYEAVVKKEMKFSDKKLQSHRDKALAAYYAVKENEGEQIYEG